jgi:hypothetical protein
MWSSSCRSIAWLNAVEQEKQEEEEEEEEEELICIAVRG